MRTLFALSLIALLLGVGVVAVIETDPGYVLLAYGNYTLETSLWVGLVLLVILMLLFHYLLRLLFGLLGGQRFLANWLGNRRSGQAARNTVRGVISYTEGNWARARRQLLRGAGGDASLPNYLLAARASDYLEERERVLEYLDAAIEDEPKAEVAVAINRAQVHLRAGEYEQARAALEPSRHNAGRHPRVLDLLLRAYAGELDWEAQARLLPEMRKHANLPAAELDELERAVSRRRLEAAADAPALHVAWQDLPFTLKQDAEMLRLYVQRQMALGDGEAAEKTILRALKKTWDGQLVRHYGLLAHGDVPARITRAERWLADHPQDPELLLCLGRLCLRDQLWGKARDYFESAYRLAPDAEVCAELGRLLVGLGEPQVAAAYYREGLQRHEADLPELPMPDKIVADHHLLDRP